MLLVAPGIKVPSVTESEVFEYHWWRRVLPAAFWAGMERRAEVEAGMDLVSVFRGGVEV